MIAVEDDGLRLQLADGLERGKVKVAARVLRPLAESGVRERLARKAGRQEVGLPHLWELDLADVSDDDVAKVAPMRLGRRLVEVVRENRPESRRAHAEVEAAASGEEADVGMRTILFRGQVVENRPGLLRERGDGGTGLPVALSPNRISACILLCPSHQTSAMFL